MKPTLTLALAALLLASFHLHAQTPAPINTPTAQFDAATIKHHNPGDTNRYSNAQGFYGMPGGRVFFGGWAKMLVMFAYGLQDYQVTGGAEWVASERFEINAVPPDDSPSRKIAIRNAEPTADQRQMLQSLLHDRFGLQCHFETREGEVYILTRGSKSLQLVPPKEPGSDPRAVVFMKGDREGMIELMGNNTTTDYLAIRLSRYLNLPVLNQTGISGSWDFHIPVDPETRDTTDQVLNMVNDLGLKTKRTRGPIQTLVIDHIDHPTTD
jgi:uncharacterized protein (TIGR03435 family)